MNVSGQVRSDLYHILQPKQHIIRGWMQKQTWESICILSLRATGELCKNVKQSVLIAKPFFVFILSIKQNGLVIILNELNHYLRISVFISNTVNTDGYNPHQQKTSLESLIIFKNWDKAEILNYFSDCKGILRSNNFRSTVLQHRRELWENLFEADPKTSSRISYLE